MKVYKVLRNVHEDTEMSQMLVSNNYALSNKPMKWMVERRSQQG